MKNRVQYVHVFVLFNVQSVLISKYIGLISLMDRKKKKSDINLYYK